MFRFNDAAKNNNKKNKTKPGDTQAGVLKTGPSGAEPAPPCFRTTRGIFSLTPTIMKSLYLGQLAGTSGPGLCNHISAQLHGHMTDGIKEHKRTRAHALVQQ